ncbi:LCP family protein [Hamadaea tsunoensis]|uniref:LCP family protein n=1 Tax=Hamadaea tsunoensis TaxID=53368 RepID=UPI00040938B3|nr:LCP family protein [Hamadaea tsunoensis]
MPAAIRDRDQGSSRSSHQLGSAGRKRKRKKAKSPLWAKIVAVLGALIVLASSGALIAAKYFLGEVENSVQHESMLGGASAPVDKAHALDGAVNILLMGVDERTVTDDPDGTRADSIIIFHINAAHTAAYFLSMPRDTLAQIPAFPKTGFKGSNEKINAAFQHGSDNGGGRTGGFELLAETISSVTGLHFNAGAIVNFAGFEAVVDALGGVDMCIDQKVTSIHMNTNGQLLATGGGTAMTYEKGCRHLEPWQALDFVRQRHTSGGDYDRQRHQQQFLKAVAKEAMSQGMTNVSKLNGLLTATGHTLTVDPGAVGLTDWIFMLKGMNIGDMQMLKTNGGQYASLKCPDGSSCQKLTPDSLDMFHAARDDTMADFVQNHPTWIAKD